MSNLNLRLGRWKEKNVWNPKAVTFWQSTGLSEASSGAAVEQTIDHGFFPSEHDNFEVCFYPP